jgi:hypothetical protein
MKNGKRRRRNKKEGIYRTANRRTVECRIMNVEGRNSIDFIKSPLPPLEKGENKFGI